MNQSLAGIDGLEDLMACNDVLCRIDNSVFELGSYAILEGR